MSQFTVDSQECLYNPGWLYARYVRDVMTLEEIAALTGSSRQAVGRALERYGIERRRAARRFVRAELDDQALAASPIRGARPDHVRYRSGARGRPEVGQPGASADRDSATTASSPQALTTVADVRCHVFDIGVLSQTARTVTHRGYAP